MQIRILLSGAILLLLLAGGCAKAPPDNTATFKESFRKSFTLSCINGVTQGANAVKTELAQEKCACMATYLVTNLSTDELTKLSLGNSPDTARIMDKAIDACK